MVGEQEVRSLKLLEEIKVDQRSVERSIRIYGHIQRSGDLSGQYISFFILGSGDVSMCTWTWLSHNVGNWLSVVYTLTKVTSFMNTILALVPFLFTFRFDCQAVKFGAAP